MIGNTQIEQPHYPPWFRGYNDEEKPEAVTFQGDGKPYNKAYYKLEQLHREYLATLDNDNQDEFYDTYRRVAEGQLELFFEWLLVNRKLDV